MPSRTKSLARPLLACEIFADRVVAARVGEARDYLEVHTSRQLPAGAVQPSLTNANVLDANVLSGRLGEALGALSGRSRDVVGVVPDAAVRVVLLDFEQLPEAHAEALGVLRFRMKKSLPFDVEKAVISYHVHRTADGLKVIATVALASVIQVSVFAFLLAGYSPGVVLPRTLAARGVVEGDLPTMVIEGGEGITSVAIVDHRPLRLLRPLDSAGLAAALDPSRLADEIYP